MDTVPHVNVVYVVYWCDLARPVTDRNIRP